MKIDKIKISETPKAGDIKKFMVLGVDKDTGKNVHAEASQLIPTVSPDQGNAIRLKGNGLFADSTKLSSGSGNLLELRGDGLYIGDYMALENNVLPCGDGSGDIGVWENYYQDLTVESMVINGRNYLHMVKTGNMRFSAISQTLSLKPNTTYTVSGESAWLNTFMVWVIRDNDTDYKDYLRDVIEGEGSFEFTTDKSDNSAITVTLWSGYMPYDICLRLCISEKETAISGHQRIESLEEQVSLLRDAPVAGANMLQCWDGSGDIAFWLMDTYYSTVEQKIIDGKSYIRAECTDVDNHGRVRQTVSLEPDTLYTITADTAEADTARLAVIRVSGGIHNYKMVQLKPGVVSYTFRTTEGDNSHVYVSLQGDTFREFSATTRMQLEKGGTATPMGPSISDLLQKEDMSSTQERPVAGEYWLDADGVTRRQVYIRTFTGITPPYQETNRMYVYLLPYTDVIHTIEVVRGYMEAPADYRAQLGIREAVTFNVPGVQSDNYWDVCKFQGGILLYYNSPNLHSRRYSVTVKYTKA